MEQAKGLTAQAPRFIIHDKETVTELEPVGAALLYTRESYKATFGGRDPVTDDGLKPVDFLTPEGKKVTGFRVAKLRDGLALLPLLLLISLMRCLILQLCH